MMFSNELQILNEEDYKINDEDDFKCNNNIRYKN